MPTYRGWLAELLRDDDQPHMRFARGMLAWLSHFVREPELLALLKTAPAEMARPVRSLIWMLDFPKDEIPEILRRPRKPRAPRPKTASPPLETQAARDAETLAPISWKKPKGSTSNPIYRNYRPPGSRPKRKTA